MRQGQSCGEKETAGSKAKVTERTEMESGASCGQCSGMAEAAG